ncbi:hypothetical protein H2200_009881 [Cladophialophora chaetospira]|uniref:Zn(2)-C6 fungal-type domain-containing protein n=1 Tax=Cladophialophora chaetospira TaxID=386627 RepID=A0AA38X3L1_9EURO|nr:hypothetical protein H2200_009881 [Cladophialophora chaetospira]
MVGTRRTNSCDTCRKRRVKCDENRPVCGQCAKGRRECKAAPLPGLNWVASGQLCVSQAQSALESDAILLEATPKLKELSLVKTTQASNGASFHKYRICPPRRPKPSALSNGNHISRTPSLTSIDQLRHVFAAAYSHSPFGHRLTAFNSRIIEVPRYLGQSSTLDQAARCLVYSHQSLLSGNEQCGIESSIYHQALRSLQESLNDPSQVYQSTTLCAVSLLSCAEILGSRSLNYNYINHANGLVTLIETSGQTIAQDDLGRYIIYSAVGPIVINALMKGIRCFLNKRQWRWLFSSWPKSPPVQATHGAVMPQFSALADLLPDIRSACGVIGSVTEAQALVPRIVAVKDGIHRAQEDINLMLGWEPSSTCLTSQNTTESNYMPLDVSYWYPDPETARVTLQCSALVIQVNSAAAALHWFLSKQHIQAFTNLSIEAMQLESRQMAEVICRSVEYAKQYTPVESLYMQYPIFCAWSVLPSDKKDWIVKELNHLNGCLLSNYNHAIMDYISDTLLGCAIPADNEVQTGHC